MQEVRSVELFTIKFHSVYFTLLGKIDSSFFLHYCLFSWLPVSLKILLAIIVKSYMVYIANVCPLLIRAILNMSMFIKRDIIINDHEFEDVKLIASSVI